MPTARSRSSRNSGTAKHSPTNSEAGTGTHHERILRRRPSQAAQSANATEFRAAYERLAPYEELARIIIMRRAALGLTQAELAARMGTTASAISRIESGQHATSAQTLKKLGDAFGARAVLGFEFGSAKHPERELVVL